MSRENLVEVYEIVEGKGRPEWNYRPGAIEFLPADAPLPQVGDIVLLPNAITGDSDEQSFIMGSMASFRVVEREFLYYRHSDEEHNPTNTKPAQYVKTWIHVKRLPREEYDLTPG